MNQHEFQQRVNAAAEKVRAGLPAVTEDIDAATIAHRLQQALGFCNCDLDNWIPTRATGHSTVCALHRLALDMVKPYAERRDHDRRQRDQRAEKLLQGLYYD